MQKRLAALGLTVGLVGGGAAGLALGVPGLSSAQSSGDSTTTTAPSSSGSSGSTATNPDRSQWITDALAPLVQNGTITQAQADAVAQALANARPPKGDHDHFGPGRKMFGGLDLETAASTIGVTTDELRQALENGQSIADVAKSKNVDPQKVIDTLVAKAKSRIDQLVTDGKITQDQANTMVTEATQRITDFVNGTFPHGIRGGGRHDGQAPGSTSTSTSTTTG